MQQQKNIKNRGSAVGQLGERLSNCLPSELHINVVPGSRLASTEIFQSGGCINLSICMWYQGHNSNTPYALFHLRYMDVNYALSQSDMLHTFFENSLLDNSIWVLCSPYLTINHNIECISVMRNLLFRILVYFYRFSRTCVLSIWLTVNGYTVMTFCYILFCLNLF